MPRYHETKDGFWKRQPSTKAAWWTVVPGEGRRSTGLRDLEAARRWRAEREREHADPAYRAAHSITVRTAVTAFVDELAIAGRAPATIDFYASKLGHALRVFGEDTKLSEVTLGATTAYVAQRLEEDASRQTVRKELAAIRTMLKAARHRGEYHQDPALALPRQFDAPNRPRKRYLPRDKFEAFLAALPPHRAAWVCYAVATGARHAEMTRARRAHVDTKKGEVLIAGTKTKESIDRVRPILPAFEALMARALLAADGEPGGPLFSPWPTSNQCRDLTRAAKLAKIDLDRVSANDLRRTFATWLVQDGVPPHVVAWLLGHTSSTMVERVYGRLDPASARELAGGAQRVPALNQPTAKAAANDNNKKG